MTRETYQLIKTASPKLGTLIGILWILSFVGIANASLSPLYSMFGFGLGIGSLFCAAIMSYQFRWRVCKGNLSFGAQWMQVLFMLLYACILMAMGVFIYMRFLDEGRFAMMYAEMMEIPEQRAAMEQMLANSGVTLEELVASITNLKPINLAIQTMESNFLVCLLIAPLITLAARIRNYRPSNEG